MLRFLLINYSSDKQICNATFAGKDIALVRCPAPIDDGGTYDPSKPDISLGKSKSGQDLELAPGHMFGFMHDSDVTLVTSAPDKVLVVVASGKNPWPPPPSAAPAFATAKDYGTRYDNFNRGSPGGPPGKMTITYGSPDTLSGNARKKSGKSK